MPHSDYEAFAVYGSPAHLRVLGRNSGTVALLLGVSLLLATAATPPATEGRVVTFALGAAATIIGAVAHMSAGRIRMWTMDVALLPTAVALPYLASSGGVLFVVTPALFVAFGVAAAVLRSRRATAFHLSLMAGSYALMLVIGPSLAKPLTWWVAAVALMIMGAGFIRWMVEKAAAVAVVDHAARLEAEANAAALGVANEAKRRFLARMSHELRTPLNAILGFADVMQLRLAGDLNDRQVEYVSDIAASGRDLLALVDDALDIEKVERGSVDLELGVVDVAALLGDALRLARGPARTAGVDLETHVAASVGEIRADNRKLHQVLTNLLGNAVRHTSAGGRVRVSAEQHRGGVRIAVADTGSGIAPDDQVRIFERYEQATDRAGGAGLGLALSRRFVEAHGGRLLVESRPGAGSTFIVEVPLIAVPNPAGRAVHEARLGDPGDAYEAFVVVDSRAHLSMLGSTAAVFSSLSAGLVALLALITPGPLTTRLAIVALAGGLFAVAAFLRNRPGGVPAPQIVLPLAMAGIGVAAAIAGPFTNLVALCFPVAWLIAASIIPVRRVLVSTAVTMAAWALVLAAEHAPLAAPRWFVLMGVTGCSINTALYVGGALRRALVAEGESRQRAEELHDALEAASAHKQDFLANMSHELRAPLNAVIGFADVLLTPMAGPLEERQREYVADIADAGRHLLALIDDLLELARLEAGRLNVDVAPTPVAPAIDAALANVRPQADARGIRVVMGPLDSVPHVLADPARLEEIIRRLLANAIKFTPDNGVVELRADERAGEVGISVTDTGIGVAPDQQPHVFEAFHQGERPLPSHAQGGAGLGLAVVKGLVQLHGGTASISSVPDEGSTLTVTVPAAAQPAAVPSMAE